MITKIELPEDIFTDAARILEIKATLQNGVDGMDKFDDERHTLLQSLKNLKTPSVSEIELIKEIEGKEAEWTAEHDRKTTELFNEECVLYEKIRSGVRNALVGRYIRYDYGEMVAYTYINKVTMYEGGKVTIAGPAVCIKDDNKIECRTIEHSLISLNNLKPTFLSAGLKYDLLFQMRKIEFCELSDITDAVKAIKKKQMDFFDRVLCHAEQMEHMQKPEDEPCHPEYWW